MCPEDPFPTGGIQKIYQQVDLLNRSGYEAYVVHTNEDYRYRWMANNTQLAVPKWTIFQKLLFAINKKKQEMAYPGKLPLKINGNEILPISKEDIVVLPEWHCYEVFPRIGDQPFVIFNQNVYLTFLGIENFKVSPYKAKNLLGVLCVSQDNLEYLRYIFPRLNIKRIRLSVDSSRFSISKNKKKQIAYMPRKCPEDAVQVVEILKERGKIKDWEFVPIMKKSSDEVAAILKESAIFMSFAYEEGFSLPPLEAMMCGCLVIGYHGEGGKEYLKEPFGIPIEGGNIEHFAKAVEEHAISYDKDTWLKQAEKNITELKAIYNEQNENADILVAWNDFLYNYKQSEK